MYQRYQKYLFITTYVRMLCNHFFHFHVAETGWELQQGRLVKNLKFSVLSGHLKKVHYEKFLHI
jgi:hypothetical protein